MKLLTLLFLTLSIPVCAQDTIRVTHNGKQVDELVQLPDTVTVIDTVYVDRPQEPEPPPPLQRIEAESANDSQGVAIRVNEAGFIEPCDWLRYNIITISDI